MRAYQGFRPSHTSKVAFRLSRHAYVSSGDGVRCARRGEIAHKSSTIFRVENTCRLLLPLVGVGTGRDTGFTCSGPRTPPQGAERDDLLTSRGARQLETTAEMVPCNSVSSPPVPLPSRVGVISWIASSQTLVKVCRGDTPLQPPAMSRRELQGGHPLHPPFFFSRITSSAEGPRKFGAGRGGP